MPPPSLADQVQTWLDTIAAGPDDLATTRATIVPRRRDESARRAEAFLNQLVERGQPVELQLGKVIGQGGMGLVREAEQVALRRVVAVKTARRGRADPSAARDLLAEAWINGALEHPNIVPVHHLEIDGDRMPLLVLKRIEGVEWSALLRDPAEVQRRFAASDLLAWNLGILHQVLHAVRFAHARGVLHRDLKPSNVMIGQFGEVYLLDWGLALGLRDDGTGRFPLAAEAADLAGTPCYMAPEMLMREGDSPLSERTDVYLAGAVLFELIAGRPPHLGATAHEVLANVVASSPALPASAPAELAQICLRAMRPDPAERFPSIEALQLALQGYLEHRGSERLMTSATTRLAELIALAAGRDPAQREPVYRQLAICRFAFHQALAVWHENAEAQQGLARANIAVAEYELACDDPRAAVSLLTELADRPALLERAQAAASAQAERRRHLEHLGRDADPTIHARTRRIAGALGFGFAVAPLLGALDPRLSARTHAQQVGWSLFCLALVAAISWWFGRSKMTAINRLAFAAGRLLFAGQVVLALGTWMLGVPAAEAQVPNLFLWGILACMFALTTDRWIALIGVDYFAGFLVAASHPAWCAYVMSVTNLVFTIVVLGRWKPAAARLAARER